MRVTLRLDPDSMSEHICDVENCGEIAEVVVGYAMEYCGAVVVCRMHWDELKQARRDRENIE